VRQFVTLANMIGNGEIQRRGASQPVSREHQQQAFSCGPSPEKLRLQTFKAFSIAPSLKITRTYRTIRLVKQNPIGADGLVAVVFDNKSLAQHPGQNIGKSAGPAT